ncbi:MAG: hypothetical protein M1827_001914 [Pycnora praestabilis]|nr:MAG: hypothetical protein M1827_001914 [Pycnora praestabilis]
MSSTTSWLTKQRKSDLVELAGNVGLTDYDGLLKTDLENALDEHMRANQTTLSKDARFNPFYKRVSSDGSPVKREASAARITSDGEIKAVKPRARRVTKARDEIEGATEESETDLRTALATRTPRSNLSYALSAPLPPSPAVVADVIDRSTADLRSHVGNIWASSGITEKVESVRETLSSVASIELLVLFIESYGLSREILPKSYYVFTMPAVPALHTPEYPVFATDLFLLLTTSFWSPFLVWASKSVLIPLFFAYFFNLTLKPHRSSHSTRSHSPSSKSHQFDPLTFNIVKALSTWMIHSQGVRCFGWIDETSVMRIEASVYGGYQGMMVGAAIGAVTSIYDAVLKK